ncbi:hypothetical protein [Umezawaea sp. Da 62-37]|uniref:hypothetical protein n=1 Tax=Umezawaea sp. Da 62-37 TaxID=3075927 RepID=UPI0028F6DC46|nr:hypothetical protein [Umezawaea sp. Da 62-37]WNV82565.1 hypothetical protein RM788_30725 [Umezawaea sp. Da 62-37]
MARLTFSPHQVPADPAQNPAKLLLFGAVLAFVLGLATFFVRFFFGLAGTLIRILDGRVGDPPQGRALNQASGDVRGNVVQVGVIRGDVTIYGSAAPDDHQHRDRGM